MKGTSLKYCGYELTDYPTLYKKVYWGHNIDNHIDIICARNKFVIEYDIQKVIRPNCVSSLSRLYRLDHALFDHIEYYRSSNGRSIILISPYRLAIDGGDKILLDTEGFVRVDDMYSKSASTFIKVFADRYEMNRWIKS